tara:strand:+ start:1015 stop:1257 length:243 start_codon:yes stop_codon:yes gene_type:complete
MSASFLRTVNPAYILIREGMKVRGLNYIELLEIIKLQMGKEYNKSHLNIGQTPYFFDEKQKKKMYICVFDKDTVSRDPLL